MRALHQQTAVIVAGPPGAGKSTVARIVADTLPAVLIDIDVVAAPLAPELTGSAWARARRERYESLLDATAEAARTGAHVAVAAPFTRERADPLAWAELCERLAGEGAEAVMAWMRVPGESLIERLAARGAGRDTAKLADPAGWLRETRPDTPPSVSHIELDGALSADAAAGALLAALSARDGHPFSGLRPTAREACSS